jgi:hypothetical protein
MSVLLSQGLPNEAAYRPTFGQPVLHRNNSLKNRAVWAVKCPEFGLRDIEIPRPKQNCHLD